MWLMIDSCGAEAVVALCESAAVVRAVGFGGRSFSGEWSAALAGLLRDAHVEVHSLGFVGVVHGPGSFTGVRVGLAAAKGLCLASETELVTVSRLAVLAEAAGAEAAMMDAGRGEVYLLAGGREILVAKDSVADVVGQQKIAESWAAEELNAAAARMLWAAWERGERADLATVDANYVRGEGQMYPARVGR